MRGVGAGLTLAVSAAALVAFACGDSSGGEGEGGEVAFPAGYASSYAEVRDCRPSGDHDLNNIRIVVDPRALGPYQDRDAPFPKGSVVLKEEYEFDDVDCSGEIKQWTVMQKLEPGSSPATLDWSWQRVDADRRLLARDEPRCVGCHTPCTGDPTGHDSTCADP